MTINIRDPETGVELPATSGQVAEIRSGLDVPSTTQMNAAIAAAIEALRNELTGTPPAPPAPTPGVGTSRLVAFGDSLTAGVAATATIFQWASIYAATLGVPLLNKGVSGSILQNSPDASGQPRLNNGRDRYEADLLGSNLSTRYAILYGLNDSRYTAAPASINVSNFTTDLTAIIDGLLESGVPPTAIAIGYPWIPDAGFSVGSTGFTGSNRTTADAYAAAVYGVAYAKGLRYARVYETMGASDMDPDNIHPNNAGHATIAAAFASALVLSVPTWPGRTGSPSPTPPSAPAAPPAPGTATAVTFSARTAELVDISAGVYGSSAGGTAFNGIGLISGMLGANVEGWIEAQYSDNTTAGAVLTLDTDGGLPIYSTNTYLAQFIPSGEVFFSSNAGSSTSTGYTFPSPSSDCRVRIARSAAGIVSIDTTTDGGANWTTRQTFPTPTTVAYYGRVYTSQARRLNQPRAIGFA